MTDAPIALPPGWRVQDDGARIGVRVRTASFRDALELFADVGEVAEELDHHPDLHLESYNRVRIETYSHDVGRLTARDERLAARIQRVLDARGLTPEP